MISKPVRDQGKRPVLDSYARESRRGDSRNMSIVGQHDENGERISALGAVLGEQLQDKGKSAWKDDVERPDWEKLLSRLETGASDGAVVWQLSRLLRQVRDAVRVVDLAKKGFKVYDGSMEYDLTTVGGREAFYNQAVANETYSGRISDNVRRGHRSKVKRGEGRTGPNRPFGFDYDRINKTIVVNPRERDAVRHIAPRIISGEMSWASAARWLNKHGHLTPTGGEWVGINLRNSLHAPRFAGYLMVDGEVAGHLKGERILEPDVWQQLVSRTKPKGRPPKGNYWPVGSKVPTRCGRCGHYLRGRSDPGGRRYIETEEGLSYLTRGQVKRHPHGDELEIKREYYCQRTTGGCGAYLIDWHVFNTLVTRIVLRLMSSPEYPAHVQRAARQDSDARGTLSGKLRDLEELLGYWDTRLNGGEITQERHLRMTADVESKIEEVRKELDAIPQLAPVVSPVDASKSAQEIWDAATPDDKTELLREALQLGNPQGPMCIVVDYGSPVGMDIAAASQRVHLKLISEWTPEYAS